MKTSMMKHNWLRLLCVLVCLSFAAGMSTGAFAAKPVDNDGDGVKSNNDCNDNDPTIWDLNTCGECAPEPAEGCDTCTPTPGEETQELSCDDNIDNDCDTYTDGDDSDCATGGACSDYASKGACNGDTSCEWQGSPKNGSCEDAACTITEDPEVSCSDGTDNDCDGQTDGADSDCDGPVEICDNLTDDDGDDLVDCADSDCTGESYCEYPEANCSDGFDNDGDSLIDGADPDCQGEICDNLADDDGDGDIDCADSDCTGESYCEYPEANCSDGFDNDGDDLVDCADPDCAGELACAAGNKLTANRVTGTVLGIGPNSGLWNATAAVTYNMAWRDDIADTCPPEQSCSGNAPTLTVKAIHNGNDIAFLMTWTDVSQSSEVYQPSEFGDRAVIMLNANRICQMGSPSNPTNMWFWNAADKTQGAGGSVQNLLGGGIGTITHTSGDDNIETASNYTAGTWQVVMSRPLAAIDPADQFEFDLGVTTDVAFALYDGAFKQRNGSKYISGRESMDIAP
jgi:DMSO reductase family type II enzyme heme b subunit